MTRRKRYYEHFNFLLPPTYLHYSFTPAYGDSLREVELIDGSMIRAQVFSMDGKTYRLRSETLGEVEIPEYRVKAIRTPKTESVWPRQRNTATSTPAPQSQTETDPDGC